MGTYTGSIALATVVPEPGTYLMMLAGVGAIGFLAFRRRNTTVAYIGPERRNGGEAEVLQQPSLMDKARVAS